MVGRGVSANGAQVHFGSFTNLAKIRKGGGCLLVRGHLGISMLGAKIRSCAKLLRRSGRIVGKFWGRLKAIRGQSIIGKEIIFLILKGDLKNVSPLC